MKILLNEPIARHGYWRVGGPMERFVTVETEDELQELLSTHPHGAPLHILGNGSNLLAPDDGLPGTTLKLSGHFRDTVPVSGGEGGEGGAETSGDRVLLRVGAGLLNTVLLQRLQKLQLGGAGALAGVPGTLGGAVAMNAGTRLGEISDVLVEIQGWIGAERVTLRREQLAMGYRIGGVPAGMVVTSVTLALSRSRFEEEQAHIHEHLHYRKTTQPLEHPSCGSVFRNPPGDAAGRLIESVGLKGHRIGGAEISARHGNFIVNLGNATSLDIMQCVRLAWETVAERRGVHLIPEVRVLGAWPPSLWPLPLPPHLQH